MFYSNFMRLCVAKGIAPTAVAEAIGVSGRSATGWKNGAKPHPATLLKIAQYFNVDVSYFEQDVPNPRRNAAKGDALEDVCSILSTEEREAALNFMLDLLKKRGVS